MADNTENNLTDYSPILCSETQLVPAGLAQHLPIVGICWASPSGAQPGVPSKAQVGPSRACPARPKWGQAGLAQHLPSIGVASF